MTSRGANTDAIYDELRRIEGAVAQCERHLAEREAQLIILQRQNEDTANVRGELEGLRTQQRAREHERNGYLRCFNRRKPSDESKSKGAANERPLPV